MQFPLLFKATLAVSTHFLSKAFSQPGTGICFVPHQIKLCKGSCNEITSFLTPLPCWNTFCNYSCSISNISDKEKDERNI